MKLMLSDMTVKLVIYTGCEVVTIRENKKAFQVTPQQSSSSIWATSLLSGPSSSEFLPQMSSSNATSSGSTSSKPKKKAFKGY